MSSDVQEDETTAIVQINTGEAIAVSTVPCRGCPEQLPDLDYVERDRLTIHPSAATRLIFAVVTGFGVLASAMAILSFRQWETTLAAILCSLSAIIISITCLYIGLLNLLDPNRVNFDLRNKQVSFVRGFLARAPSLKVAFDEILFMQIVSYVARFDSSDYKVYELNLVVRTARVDRHTLARYKHYGAILILADILSEALGVQVANHTGEPPPTSKR